MKHVTLKESKRRYPRENDRTLKEIARSQEEAFSSVAGHAFIGVAWSCATTSSTAAQRDGPARDLCLSLSALTERRSAALRLREDLRESFASVVGGISPRDYVVRPALLKIGCRYGRADIRAEAASASQSAQIGPPDITRSCWRSPFPARSHLRLEI